MNIVPSASVGVCMLSYIWLFATPWTVAHQDPLSMGLCQQEYWSELRFPPPGIFPSQERWILYHWATWEAHTIGSVPFSSIAQSCPTLCDPVDCSTAGFPVHHQLPEPAQTHVHWASDAIQPSHPLSSPFPPASIFPSIRVFSNESVLRIRWSKYWSFSFSISPSNEYSGLISFRMDWLDLLAVQGILKSLLQHHSPKASVLQCSAFFMVRLSHPYVTTGKTIALTIQTFVGKVISLLFNMLSSLVIGLLPRSKCLLISWLQSPSALILEPKKIVCYCFHCFPIYLPWSDGTKYHDLSFLSVEF